MYYSAKIINNLQPSGVTKKEKAAMRQGHKEAWNNKPPAIHPGTKLIAITGTGTITKGRTYSSRNHFCSLVTTIYGSQWHQFVTIKNNRGWTVKVNLNKFTRSLFQKP